MSDRTFRLMYEPVTGGRFPQAVVFDREGRCVATLTESADPVESVREALAVRETACPMITREEFGATAPGGEGSPGVNVVELIVVKLDFCPDCREWRDRLVEAFRDDATVELRIREVGG